MKYILHKISAPGWTKSFDTEDERKAELWAHICHMCREGTEEEGYSEPPLDENSTVEDLLCSPCGCEFDIEDV